MTIARMPQLLEKSVSRSAAGLGGCCYTYPGRLSDEAIECYLRPLVSTALRKRQLHAYCVALASSPLLAIEPRARTSFPGRDAGPDRGRSASALARRRE